MVPQARQLVLQLGPDGREEGLVARIYGAGEHQVVPHHYAQLVADVVEAVLLVLSAAPEADHVHVRRGGALQQVAVALGRLLVLERAAGHPVGAFGEHFASVHAECHARARLAVLVLVRSVEHLDLP